SRMMDRSNGLILSALGDVRLIVCLLLPDATIFSHRPPLLAKCFRPRISPMVNLGNAGGPASLECQLPGTLVSQGFHGRMAFGVCPLLVLPILNKPPLD